jgi:hypothetical protein
MWRTRRINLGRETSWGTPVAATAKLMSVTEATVTPIRERVRPEEIRGSLMPHFHIFDVFHAFEADIQGFLTLEDILFPLSNILGQTTPTAPGAGQDNYTWVFSGPLTSVPGLLPVTIEWTDSVRGYQGQGGLGQELVISAQVNQEARYRWRVRGRQIAQAAAQSLPERLVTPLAANLFTVDRADDAANPTYSPLLGVVRQWELTIRSGLTLVPTQSGVLTATAFGLQGYVGTLRMVVLHRSPEGTGIIDDFLAGTGFPPIGKLVILRFRSAQYYGTPPAQLTIEFACVPVAVTELFTNADGLTAFQVEFHVRYAPLWGKWLSVTVVNNVASLP